ncbi:DUF2927 domain-containing protein [Thalassobius sp. Cn5-15]|uniref:DUF2927 domain-containing protein n=1 Tax=Thalassobius sp. Cn5-15 TaxID=2917763 RepID=UPI001EF2F34F|nr:DUF2927 domain-containing protein [Thalassobius sp. Cn5-15]MCG7493246.1 DUF2927 domain-containing protein [Thalassobius sp. Cn5-15]
MRPHAHQARPKAALNLSAALGVLGLVAACTPLNVSPAPVAPPKARVAPQPEVIPASAPAQTLARYYATLQADQLVQGLLRTDGGGIDTPYTARQLAENYEAIAFYQEYQNGSWQRQADATPSQLRRWADPIGVNVEFGRSVPLEQRQLDRTNTRLFTQRLSRITRHPMSMAPAARANFHVFFTGYDDQAQLMTRLRQVLPGADPTSLRLVATMPRSTHCLMLSFGGPRQPQEITRTVVVIRAEHPDILRKSCIHEEMAQGMGLINDSPRARPSIFNDDDEFAFLTSHDERLLAMHYDRRLRIGMPLPEARPIVRQLAAEQMGAQI